MTTASTQRLDAKPFANMMTNEKRSTGWPLGRWLMSERGRELAELMSSPANTRLGAEAGQSRESQHSHEHCNRG